ncbi:ATP-grasp domain-containing protein [Bacillus cereus]|uniref:ATP-grasp domain-containing protein n=1 Tax=Bacillus cereus TaxID=1396 RepID=UPI003D01098C|nr:ATP-grasp domain-containing protein [Bacillus cereus]MDA2555801.1 ATP-grasp domain-containing protein [Bacillus cereus]
MNVKKVGLVMRKGCSIHGDHIETLGRLVDSIHLWTCVEEDLNDPRFTYVHKVNQNNTDENIIEEIRIAALENGIDKFITWHETDITLVAQLNSLFGYLDVPVEAALTSRDKANQREFLKINNIPSPISIKVSELEEAKEAAHKIGYPVILKPTRAASSMNVSLVNSDEQLEEEFEKLYQLAYSKKGFYYNDTFLNLALIEEFMSGEEVTLDGIVVEGNFYLGGIHHKKDMLGPYFEEDEYSLPYCGNEENELVTIAKNICSALHIKNSLFNVELRKDKHNNYKVVEFSIRISAGHVYRNIRDVHGIDLVAAHALKIVDSNSDEYKFFLKRASFPKASTCIKFVYREGLVQSNSSGNAANSANFRAYYPLAQENEIVNRAPKGFDIVGLLSVRGRYNSVEDRYKTIDIANSLEKELDLKVLLNPLKEGEHIAN